MYWYMETNKEKGSDRPRKLEADPLNPRLLPDWAPYLSVKDVAILYRTTPAAIRKAIETGDDKLGGQLKSFLVEVTPHRRLFDRRALMAWIQKSLPAAESA